MYLGRHRLPCKIERGILGLDLISAQAWRGTQTNSQSSSGGVSRGGLGGPKIGPKFWTLQRKWTRQGLRWVRIGPKSNVIQSASRSPPGQAASCWCCVCFFLHTGAVSCRIFGVEPFLWNSAPFWGHFYQFSSPFGVNFATLGSLLEHF